MRTDALADTFPSFKNEKAVAEFRDFLDNLRNQLKAPNQEIGFLRAATIIDQIMHKNEQTLDLPDRVLIYEMAEGATSTLDKFSSVIWPEEKQNFNRSTQGKFYGVGIRISREDGRLTVESPLPGTPAYRAGIQADDVIAKVDGKDTSAWSLNKAVRHITGPEGTIVTLGIERRGQPELIEYDIRRAEIEIKSILGWQHTENGGWNYFIDPQDHIGYVRLTQFIPQSVNDLDDAVNQMQQNGPINGLILDLRFNPGGLLSSAVDVADRFISEGPIVFTVDGDGHRTDERRAKRHRTYQPFPVVVAVNQGSASASEIVTGALQDYGRAVVVGTRSFGKGSVQDLFPLDNYKAYFKLTTQHYMLPLGRIIHRMPHSKTWGIEPDLKVKMTNEQVADAIDFRREVDVIRPADAAGQKAQPKADEILSKGMDPQLEAALLVLKTRLAAEHIAMTQTAESHASSK